MYHTLENTSLFEHLLESPSEINQYEGIEQTLEFLSQVPWTKEQFADITSNPKFEEITLPSNLISAFNDGLNFEEFKEEIDDEDNEDEEEQEGEESEEDLQEEPDLEMNNDKSMEIKN